MSDLPIFRQVLDIRPPLSPRLGTPPKRGSPANRAFGDLIRVHRQMNEGQPEDERRFHEAYLRDWPAVFRFAVAWTNDLSSAEDIAQEAFLRLWDRRMSVDWERPVIPWLLVVTRRLATDRFRRLRVPFVPPPVRDLNEDGVAAWLDVRAAFARLSARERAALVSTTVLGLTPAEASEVLGMSPGAIRAAVSRARDKLEGAR